MIDHVSVAVRDLRRASDFYDAVLAPLGYAKLATRPATVAFGKNYSEFWINHRPRCAAAVGPRRACRASGREPRSGDAFHAAALAKGGTATAHRRYGRSMARAITPPLSATRTAIASKR